MLSRKQQRHLSKLEATLGADHVPVAATDSRLASRGPHLAEHASPEDNPYQVAEARLSQLLKQHKRRRARGQVSRPPQTAEVSGCEGVKHTELVITRSVLGLLLMPPRFG